VLLLLLQVTFGLVSHSCNMVLMLGYPQTSFFWCGGLLITKHSNGVMIHAAMTTKYI
jgi:hypothetical protein